MSAEFFNLVEARRAIKEFDDSHALPEEDLAKILTAAHLSPTAFNIQNYRFVVVQDKKFRHSAEFLEACWNQDKAATCSALVILCADKGGWRYPERFWRNEGEELQNRMRGMINSYYDGKEQVQVDECHRSCGMAGMTIMLAAQALGYHTCPMDGFDYGKVGKLINLPNDHIVSFMVAIGRKTAEPFPRPTLLPRDEIVIREKFSW
ncbi:MAG: nitroreductase family protein [Alphaproteobacteria bacterium]|nr:nitroreductase family protein [Alphaproteobacteria bacterium]